MGKEQHRHDISDRAWEKIRPYTMLPFASLSLSTLDGHKGTYALISKDEDRSRPLILRKPSVRKKLQELSSLPKTSAQRRAGEPER